MKHQFRNQGNHDVWIDTKHTCIFGCMSGILYITHDTIVLKEAYTTKIIGTTLNIVKKDVKQ